MEWSTDTVLASTLQSCVTQGLLADADSLPTLRDIDTIEVRETSHVGTSFCLHGTEVMKGPRGFCRFTPKDVVQDLQEWLRDSKEGHFQSEVKAIIAQQ